jgi:hypothetical protein
VTLEALSRLPVGTVVRVDDEEGEIIRSGAEVWILWHQSKCTNCIDTKSKVWDTFVCYLEAK